MPLRIIPRMESRPMAHLFGGAARVVWEPEPFIPGSLAIVYQRNYPTRIVERLYAPKLLRSMK